MGGEERRACIQRPVDKGVGCKGSSGWRNAEQYGVAQRGLYSHCPGCFQMRCFIIFSQLPCGDCHWFSGMDGSDVLRSGKHELGIDRDPSATQFSTLVTHWEIITCQKLLVKLLIYNVHFEVYTN